MLQTCFDHCSHSACWKQALNAFISWWLSMLSQGFTYMSYHVSMMTFTSKSKKKHIVQYHVYLVDRLVSDPNMNMKYMIYERTFVNINLFLLCKVCLWWCSLVLADESHVNIAWLPEYTNTSLQVGRWFNDMQACLLATSLAQSSACWSVGNLSMTSYLQQISLSVTCSIREVLPIYIYIYIIIYEY